METFLHPAAATDAPQGSPVSPPLTGEMRLAPAETDRIPHLIHSLTTLSRLHGHGVSPLLLMSGAAGLTASPAACLRAAQRAGLEGRIIPLDDVRFISPLALPCIPLLKYNRSCVLTKLGETEAEIILPEDGETPRSVPLDQLQADFAGHVLFARPAPKFERRTESGRFFHEKRWFWGVLFHYLPIYKHVIVASAIINIIGVAGSLFTMNVYDRVVPNNATATLWVLTSGILLAYFCDFLLRNLRGYFVDVAGRNADVVISSKLVNKVLNMRFEKKPESTGALVNNLREFEALRDFFSSGTLLTFVDLPFLALFLGLTAFIGGPLVFVPLSAVPVMIGGGLWIQWAARRASEHGFRQNMQKNALLVEMVNGLEAIKGGMAENRMLRQWEQVVGASALASATSRRYTTLATTLSSSLVQLVTVGMIAWGVYLIAEGRLTMGALIGCNILVGRAMSPLMQLSSMLSRWQQSRMALKALDTLMDTPSENDEEDSPVNAATLEPLLSLDGVSFSYPGSQRASLEDVSLAIRPGEHVGIIGRVGSGKSTVGRLLIGLYPPDKGAVRFGGVDIRQLNTADLRGRIGYLPQDVVLFYGSIRDNIALDDPAVQERLVSRAAGLAGVTEFVRLHPAGFGAQVGERGMNLSGGQRQSIALARALLHDPDVLILDEPTSNMDTATENMVRERLQPALKDKTLVLITHRMSMLQLVRRVVVIEEGRIVADGPKEQVLRGLASMPQAPRPDSRPPEKKAEPATGSTPFSSHPLPGAAS